MTTTHGSIHTYLHQLQVRRELICILEKSSESISGAGDNHHSYVQTVFSLMDHLANVSKVIKKMGLFTFA